MLYLHKLPFSHRLFLDGVIKKKARNIHIERPRRRRGIKKTPIVKMSEVNISLSSYAL